MKLDLKTATLIALICVGLSALFALYELLDSLNYGNSYYPIRNLIALSAQISIGVFLFVLFSKQKNQ